MCHKPEGNTTAWYPIDKQRTLSVFHAPFGEFVLCLSAVSACGRAQGCSTLESLVGEEPVEVEGIVVEAQADITDAIKMQQVEGKAP